MQQEYIENLEAIKNKYSKSSSNKNTCSETLEATTKGIFQKKNISNKKYM